MGWLEDRIVVLNDTEWEPSRLDFWVLSASDVQITVNSSKDCSVYFTLLAIQSINEDLLETTEVIFVVLEVRWRFRALHLNVVISKFLGAVKRLSGEVKLNWRKASSIDPGSPVNGSLDLSTVIGQHRIAVVLESLSEGVVIDGGQRVGVNVLSQEVLHVSFAKLRLEEIQELEALLVRHGGERIIWEAITNLRVKGSIVVVEAIAQHIVDHGNISEIGVDHRLVNSL